MARKLKFVGPPSSGRIWQQNRWRWKALEEGFKAQYVVQSVVAENSQIKARKMLVSTVTSRVDSGGYKRWFALHHYEFGRVEGDGKFMGGGWSWGGLMAEKSQVKTSVSKRGGRGDGYWIT